MRYYCKSFVLPLGKGHSSVGKEAKDLRPVGDLRSRTARSEMIGLKMQKAAAVWI